MKNSKNIFILTMICVACTSLHAQSNGTDTTYHRQISVERDYNPTLQDENKINTQPSVYQPTIKKINAPLATSVASINPKMTDLTKISAGDFGTEIEHDKKIGYLGFRIGTCSNIEGEAGIQAISDETTKLNFFGTYNSSSAKPGHINYLTKNDIKAKFSDLLLKATFQQKFNPLTMYLNASFNSQGYNYYGATYSGFNNTTIDNKQTANIFHIKAGVKSKNQTILKYTAFVSYDHLGLKYGEGVSDSYGAGPKVNLLNADLNFNTNFGSDMIVGINIHALNQSSDYNDQHSLTHFKFNPYFDITGSNWNATIGVNGHFIFDQTDKILLTPNIAFNYNFQETSTFYADIKGDINENTYLDILQENRYADPTTRITPSRTYCDATLGIKTGIVKGFEFNIFGGYKYTTREHLFYASSVGEWENISSALYAKIGQGKFGGSVKTNLIPFTDLSARLTGYFYSVNYHDESLTISETAWNKPTYTIELNADIKPIDKLVVSANYLLAGGRKYFNESTYDKGNMNAINELNAKGSYQFTDMISVNVSVNDFLNQKYEYAPGYANYGMNILGGVSLKF